MTDFLQQLDTLCFYFFNRTIQNSFFDVLMPWITDLNKQRPVLAVVAILLGTLAYRGGRKERVAVFVLVVAVAISDHMNSSIVKYLLERPRPCHVLTNVHLLVGCGSGYSFPSSHAVNNFCGAIVLAFFFQKAARWLFLFAATVAFSRVYVGVHYPSDVLAGAVIGLACGLTAIGLFLLLEKAFRHFPKFKP
jgi:undecaprenyl-diphosphatase